MEDYKEYKEEFEQLGITNTEQMKIVIDYLKAMAEIGYDYYCRNQKPSSKCTNSQTVLF